MENLNKVRYILLCLYFSFIVLTIVVILLFETNADATGLLAGTDNRTEFAVTAAMELMTIAAIPVALRLFRFRSIDARLRTFHEAALRKWGSVRLFMLGMPLLVNTLLYYMYLNASFAYLAAILFLCMAFVFPGKDKCLREACLNETTEAS